MKERLFWVFKVRFTFVLISAVLLLIIFSTPAAAAIYGDVNNDGKVNVQDVVLVMQHILLLDKTPFTEAKIIAADVNGDGVIDVRDVTLMSQKTLKLIDVFPVEARALQVASVKAVNPKQVEVRFSRILTGTEKAKMTPANFHLGLDFLPSIDRLPGVTNDGSSVKVLSDNKTTLLTLANGYNFTSGTTANRAVVKKEVGLTSDYIVNNLAFTDDRAPVLESVRGVGTRTVVLTFSEPLDRSIVPDRIVLTSSTGRVSLHLAGAVYYDAQRELRISAFSNLAAGTYTLSILSGNNLRDYSGKAVPAVSITFTFTPQADKEAPTASVKVVSGSNTELDVQYSEAVKGATVKNNYLLKKGTETVPISTITSMGNNRYRIKAATQMQGNHTLTISNIRDTSAAQNPMGTKTYTFNVPDIIKPVVGEVRANKNVVAESDVIYITYSKNMGATAVNAGYYRLVNASKTAQYNLPAGTKITKAAGVVKIVLPKNLGQLRTDFGSTSALTHLYIGEVKDLAGNTLSNPGIKSIQPSVKFDASPVNVTVNSQTQVSFTVGRHIASLDRTGIRATAGPVSATSASFTNNTNGTATVTAYFPAGTFSTGLTGQTLNIEEDALTDMNGLRNSNKYRVGGTNIPITVDRAAPVLLGAETKDINANGQLDRIDVIYSEAIYPGSVTTASYTVQGYNITSVNVTGEVVRINLEEKGSPDTGHKPMVTQIEPVRDNIAAPGNTLGPQAGVTPVDKAKPVMVSAASVAENMIEITYSEDVINNNANPEQYVFEGSNQAVSLTVTGNKITITLSTGSIAPGTSYPGAVITYTESDITANRTRDATGNDALTPQSLIGVDAGFDTI